MRTQPIPLVGGSYADETRPWSQQDTVNYLPCLAEVAGTRSEGELKTPPGLKPFVEIVDAPPARRTHNAEGKLFAVIGPTLYQISNAGVAIPIGNVPGIGRVVMAHNQISLGNEVLAVNGQAGYVYNTVTGVFGRITDPGYPGSATAVFIDGYLIQIEPQGRFAFNSDVANATQYNTLDRFTSEVSPDRLVAPAVFNNKLLLLSRTTSEWFENTGASQQPFRSTRITMDKGCAGPYVVAHADNTVFFLGSDGMFYMVEGYRPVRISRRPLEQAIRGLNWAQAFAEVWEDAGFTVVYWTFPDGRTWGYNTADKEWHRRESYGLNRWRVNTMTRWNEVCIAGDFQTGRLWELDWDYILEGDQEFVSERTLAVIHDNQNLVLIPRVEVVMDTGQPETVPIPFPEQPDPPTITGDYPDGELGVPFDAYPYTLGGGTPPYTVTKRSGEFPTGIGPIATTGIVPAGTPTATGEFSWKLRNTDANGLWAELDDTSSIGVVWYAVDGDPLIGGPAEYARSAAGVDWSSALLTIPGTGSGRSYILTGGDLVVMYTLGEASASDDGGATWTNSGATTFMDRRGLYHDGNFYAGSMTAGADNGIYKSADGVAWTRINTFDSAFDIAAKEDRFVIVGDEFAQTSDDECVTLTPAAAFPYISNAAITVIAVSEDRFIVGTGTTTGPAMAKSDSDGVTWSSVSQPFDATDTGNQVTCIAWGDDVWVAGSLNGEIAYSTDDGDTWELAAYGLTSFGWREVAYGAGRFVMVGGNGEMATATSAAPDIWTDLPNQFGTTTVRSIAAAA